MNEILVYLSIVHDGDWNKIYNSILQKEPVDKNVVISVVSSLDCNYVTILDNNYPICLKSIYKPPFVLFYKGNYSLLDNDKKRIAVIGSRLNSEYGKVATEEICKDLIRKENVVIISGCAKGIDSIAHNCCLDNNGKTIGVLGNGINVIYPKENDKLYKSIISNGLLISEYPPDVMPIKDNFPNRNRIIAGLSEGIVVVEAKEKSGTMNTVSHALEDGKQIFCVPERYDAKSGCNKLIKEGAKLVENANDILDEL